MDAPGFEGAKYVFTPPLREKWHQEKLWNGLKRDHLQVVSTDHCPFCFKEQKEMGRDDFTKIPNGGPGVEHRMSLIYSGGVASGRFSANRFVELVSTTPAKLFGLYPRKGTIAVGSDADLVIFDPKRKHTISAKTHHMRVDYSMFEGIQVTGMPDVVLSRGQSRGGRRQVPGPRGPGRISAARDLCAGERLESDCILRLAQSGVECFFPALVVDRPADFRFPFLSAGSHTARLRSSSATFRRSTTVMPRVSSLCVSTST